ncbi:MAG: GNAT family N-acetyltransferase [Candidatus Wallbacteria bacterium]|nr:GNAT family N-acetyltransferase [Candidatus Wallbacteria bacterium]
MKVGIVYNLVEHPERGLEKDILADNDVIRMAADVKSALRDRHCVFTIKIDHETLFGMSKKSFDIVFNLCEGLDGNVAGEALFAAVLETKGIPFTGGNSLTLGLCCDKSKTKDILAENDIPTPKHQVFTADDKKISLEKYLRYPLIVKPVHEDASIGISDSSVVRNRTELEHQVKFIIESYRQPALVEEFIDGRELNVSVIGNGDSAQALPVAEIDFQLSADRPKILTYEAKWAAESEESRLTPVICPARLSKALEKKVKRMALAASRITGCRDYARVDFRLLDDEPYVIDINPNPDLSRSAGLARSAGVAGFSYQQLVEYILDSAISRCHDFQVHLPPEVVFSSDRLTSTRVMPEDAEMMIGWFNDSLVSQYMAAPEEVWSEDSFLKKFFVLNQDDLDILMCDKITGEKIGWGQIYSIDTANQSAEISFLIGDHRYHGKGYGKELARIMLAVAFEKLNLNSIHARVVHENVASIKACLRAGFREVGSMLQSDISAGQKRNERILQITREEFFQAGLRPEPEGITQN